MVSLERKGTYMDAPLKASQGWSWQYILPVYFYCNEPVYNLTVWKNTAVPDIYPASQLEIIVTPGP